MTLPGALLWAAVIAAAAVAVRIAIAVAWRGIGAYPVRRAGPRRLRASRHLIWRDPGPVESRDLRYRPGGADDVPAPPSRYLEEHTSGSQPCLSVADARGRDGARVGTRSARRGVRGPFGHARWFHTVARGFTERQLVDGLLASGATEEESQRFAVALMSRLAQLELKYSP